LPTEAKKELRDRLQAQRDQAIADHRLAHSESAARLVSSYLHDPVGWTRRFVYWRDGEGLAAYQNEVLNDLITRRRVAVRGPHGLGKTTDEALAVLWFATTREAAGIDWKVITTAGAWRQLKEYLWPEIHKWAKRLRWDLLGRSPFRPGRELLDLSLSLVYGSAFAVASDNPALIEGAHADHLLYVFDESKSIVPGVWDAAEGAFSGATDGREAYALAQSTPGEPAGRFYEIHKRAPGLEDWHARHVTLTDTIAAGRVSQDWADRRRRQWGTDSAVYANRVLGEFHSSDEDAVIPLAWVEEANERWQIWQDTHGPDRHGRRVVGVDVARSGEDLTALAIRQGDVVEELRVYAKQDTMTTTGKAGGLLKDGTGTSVAVVDTDGLGAGVTDRLREQGYRVVAFHAGAKTDRKDRSGELGFVNVRSAAWWNLREMLDPAYGEQIALPPDAELIGDLTAPHWDVLSGSKIAVESRDSLIKRLGRSPDRGTAVMQAFWTPSQVSTTDGGAVASYDGFDDDPALSTSRW
jgi:hypothetical protein